jgi:mannosyltransferase OCH1-like enzyme
MNKITEFKEAHESWKTFNPDYEIRYWSCEDCENYLIENFDERYIKIIHGFS